MECTPELIHRGSVSQVAAMDQDIRTLKRQLIRRESEAVRIGEDKQVGLDAPRHSDRNSTMFQGMRSGKESEIIDSVSDL